MEVEHWDADRDGPLTEQTMRRKLEARGYRVARYVYSPGTYFPEHSHGIDKIDAVLAGSVSHEHGVPNRWCSKPVTAWRCRAASCTARKSWATLRS